MDLDTIYLICAVAGGAVLVLRMILMVIGVDHSDVDADVDVGGDVDAGAHGPEDAGGSGFFSFFSIQSIAGFFTMFGLVGLGLLNVNAGPVWSLVGALAAGIFTAWSTGMIFLGMRRLQSDGTMVVTNAIGKEGTVYLTIPEKGTGAVSVSFQGSQKTLDAVSEKGIRIPTGSLVKIVGVTAGKILVVTEKVAEA